MFWKCSLCKLELLKLCARQKRRGDQTRSLKRCTNKPRNGATGSAGRARTSHASAMKQSRASSGSGGRAAASPRSTAAAVAAVASPRQLLVNSRLHFQLDTHKVFLQRLQAHMHRSSTALARVERTDRVQERDAFGLRFFLRHVQRRLLTFVPASTHLRPEFGACCLECAATS